MNPIRVYRDDGPLASQLGVLAGGQIPALLTAFAGAVVTLILVLTGVSDLPGITIATPVVAMLLAGLGGGAAHRGRLDWLIPPILRVTEYTFIAVVGLSSTAPRPVVYVLLAAMAFHHYDLVYRVRQRIAPPELGEPRRPGLGRAHARRRRGRDVRYRAVRVRCARGLPLGALRRGERPELACHTPAGRPDR